MHTSVEKHSLRVVKSCGTLAVSQNGIASGARYGRGFSFKLLSTMQSDRATCGDGLAHLPLHIFRSSERHLCRYTFGALGIARCALQSTATDCFRSCPKDHLQNMPRRPNAATAAPPPPLISNERLQHLYVTLLRTRLVRQRNRLKGTAAPLIAREAIVTGTVTHLEDGDVVMPVVGDRLSALARGHALRRILAGAPLPGVLASAPTTEARFAIATGHALARQGTNQVALVFSGSGITSLDALRPSLAYAAAHKLGIVFVIETAADSDVSSARHTKPLGLYGIPVDGNDVVAIYRVAQEAILRARRGVGPTLIDCKPWPLDGGTDPVRRLEQALERRGLLSGKLKERTLAAFQRELSAATRKRR
jgi:dehydrogenase E1 component